MIAPHELPQIFEQNSELGLSLEQIETDNSTDHDLNHDSSNDPLLEFLDRRKKQRVHFEHRYSKKAIGLTAYIKQKESALSSEQHTGFLLNSE